MPFCVNVYLSMDGRSAKPTWWWWWWWWMIIIIITTTTCSVESLRFVILTDLILHLVPLTCSTEMSPSEVFHQSLLHPRRLHSGGPESIPAHSSSVLPGGDEGVPLRSAASGKRTRSWGLALGYVSVLICVFFFFVCILLLGQEFKPHIFVVAEEAYRNIQGQVEPVDQSLVVSGESGAGKVGHALQVRILPSAPWRSKENEIRPLFLHQTWTTRCLMKYYSTIAASSSQKCQNMIERIEKRVLDSNPIMEAFGETQGWWFEAICSLGSWEFYLHKEKSDCGGGGSQATRGGATKTSEWLVLPPPVA